MIDDGPVIECSVSFKRASHGRKRLVERATAPTPSARIPRVSKLVALSLRINGLIDRGELKDWAEAARLSHVTRARASQIAALSLLAPDIIEQVLHLPLVERGRDPINEHDLRPIATVVGWSKQRRLWCELRRERNVASGS